MAIIYSYDDNHNILDTDILVGTSTIKINNKPQNITKNFSFKDISNFVVSNIDKGDLSKIDDINVTLTLEGLPLKSMFNDVTIKAGWTGKLSDNRIFSAQYWNAKQDTITLTTIGTQGSSTLENNVLNIPKYNGSFTYSQNIPSTIWNIEHNMNRFPSVVVVNINNVVMYGNIIYMDGNNIRIEFSAGFSGKAYLN